MVLLIRILVKIAEADGHFTKAELRAILNFFQYNLNYSQDQMYWVKQVIREAPPSGGCVLKLTIRNKEIPLREQPPSGGCVLKQAT